MNAKELSAVLFGICLFMTITFITLYLNVLTVKNYLTDSLKIKTELIVEQKPRILCWILTSPQNRVDRAVHVQNTWGKRCDKLLLMSSQDDNQTDIVVALPVVDGYTILWNKTVSALKYLYKHHLDDADWFVKADDDTYVVVDNLRHMLRPYSPDLAIHFGFRYKADHPEGYMAGACYVLSRNTLRTLVEQAFQPGHACLTQEGLFEDLALGECLSLVNITAEDGRDELKRERFFPLMIHQFLFDRGVERWFEDMAYYPVSIGMNSVSNSAIAFHYTSPWEMYMFDYFLYDFQLRE